MSDFTIKVSSETMVQQASAIQTAVNNIRQNLHNIGERVAQTRNYWEGEASNSHINTYNSELKNQCDEILNRLFEHPNDLLKMAGIYEQTEKEDVENIVSLPQNIFS